MELVVEVLGMIEGAMENAGRERLYRQASHLQADAKRLRNILSSSTHVCKDFSCSIYQGLVYVKSVGENNLTFVTATDPHTIVEADCSAFPELRSIFVNNPIFEVHGNIAVYQFAPGDVGRQTAARGAICGTLCSVTNTETVTGFVQLLTSKWRARDLSAVVDRHASNDSSSSDALESCTAPNEFDQAVVHILYAEKYYQCLLKGKWEQARMLDLGKHNFSEVNHAQLACEKNRFVSQRNATDPTVSGDIGVRSGNNDSNSDPGSNDSDSESASADEGELIAPCDGWSNGFFMPVPSHTSAARDNHDHAAAANAAAAATAAQDEDGCLMS